MLTEQEWARLRAMFAEIVREELERYDIKRKPPSDITEKRRAAARVMLANKAKRAFAEQNAKQAKVNGSAHPRANAQQKAATAEQNVLVWLAYAEAYRGRYHCDPVRNAKVNGQLSQLVKRLGPDAAPVAAWFLAHGAARYVAAGHTVGLMLVDAEKLHTEWQTGKRITATAAVQSDKTQANGDMWGRLIEEARHG